MIFTSVFVLAISLPLLLGSSTEPHGPTLEYKIAIGFLDATHHNGSNTRFVVNPELPINVENNAYFWDSRYLPKNNSTFHEFESGNKRGNLTLCDVDKQHKCSSSFDVMISIFKHNVTFDSGEIPSQLVWLCQPPKFCCEHKCCDPSSPYNKMLTGSAFLLLFVPFCIAMYRMTAGDDEEKKDKKESHHRSSRRSTNETRI